MLLSVLAASWLCLYIDSVHQRRRAEHLISELKSFPFATAGFVEVRELANRYGGVAVQSFPLQPFFPSQPWWREEEERVLQLRNGPACTVQNCTFNIWIGPRIMKLRFNIDEDLFVDSILARLGLRPWTVDARLEVKDGKLLESRTTVGQLGFAGFGSFRMIMPLEYQVESGPTIDGLNGDSDVYGVSVRHIKGVYGYLDHLDAVFEPTANAPANRAFDVRLHCFTRITSACRGFAELAPTAWSDYQARKERNRK